MPTTTYSIYNNSTNTTATISYFDIETDLSKHQHRLQIPVTWNSPFNAAPYNDFTGPTTLTVRSKNYQNSVGNINYQTTVITTNTVLLELESTEGIQLGWIASNINFIYNSQTVTNIISTTTLEISSEPDIVPFNAGETITFIPPEYLLDLDNTTDLQIGWSAFGNGYNGQVIININSATQVVMSGQPASTPVFDDPIEFSSLNDVMLEIPPLSSNTFVMDYDRNTSAYGSYISTVTLHAILGTDVSKPIYNITYIYPTPPPEVPPAPPPTPYYDSTPGDPPLPPQPDYGSTSVTTAPSAPPPIPTDSTISGDGVSVTTETFGFDDGSTLSITTVDGQITSITSTDATECFSADTMITMADGSMKKIIDVNLGDLVRGLNGINKVLAVMQFTAGTNKLHGFNGIEPFVTSCHPILTKDGWAAFDPEFLQKNWPEDWKILCEENGGSVHRVSDQSLLGFYNQALEFTKIQNHVHIDVPSDYKVYNLVLDGDHTFIANTLVVHNKCFEAGTKVLMADKTIKNIEDVKVGEFVLGADNSVNVVELFHRPTLGKMNDLLNKNGLSDLKIAVINGTNLRFSEDHMFMTTEGWKAPNVDKSVLLHKTMLERDSIKLLQLKVGDELVTDQNKTIKVKSIEFFDDTPELQLYNFRLSGNKTYYVEVQNEKFALVHNKKVICTELYRQGFLDLDIYQIDQKFGESLLKNNPNMYWGYRIWADILVDYMQGRGKPMIPRLLFWLSKDQQQKLSKKIAVGLAKILGIPFAYELARREHNTKKFNIVGYLIVTFGLKICEIIYKVKNKK